MVFNVTQQKKIKNYSVDKAKKLLCLVPCPRVKASAMIKFVEKKSSFHLITFLLNRLAWENDVPVHFSPEREYQFLPHEKQILGYQEV